MRILCAADLHLGRHSSLLQEGDLEFDTSSAAAWGRLCDLAIVERADALLLAGDVFDDLSAVYQCRVAFDRGVRRLREAGIPVVAVSGNHDHDAWTALGSGVEGLRWLGRGATWEEAVVETRSGEFAVVGWSFSTAQHMRGPLHVPPPQPSLRPVVGLVHGDLDVTKSDYAPLSRSELELAGFDAWVLGHIHKPAVYSDVPVAYPGSPQALDFGETGAHGAIWLMLKDGKAEFSQVVPLSSVQYEELDLEVDAEGVTGNALPALERRLVELDQGYREGKPHLKSAQYRLRVRLLNAEKDVSLEAVPTEWMSGSAYQVVSWARVTTRSLWELSMQTDAVGQVARMLIGLRAEDGRYEGQEVDKEWPKNAERVLERCADRVSAVFGEVTRVAIESEGYESLTDAQRWAREIVDAQLSEALAGAELQEESA